MNITRGIDPKPLKGVIYGPEGVGKSSLAKGFPDALFTDVESGTTMLDVARTPRPHTWAELQQYARELAGNTHGFKTWVIDTADWAERLSIAAVCAEYGIVGLGQDSGGKKDYGKSYAYLLQKWSEFLTQVEADLIDTRKMHVVFLAHSTTIKFELPEEAGEFDRYQLAMQRKVAEILKSWADLLLFCNYQTIVTYDEKTKRHSAQGGVRRMMYTERRAAFDAKNRFGLPAEADLRADLLLPCFCDLSAQAPAPAPVQAPAPQPAPVPAPQPAQDEPGLSRDHQNLIRMMESAGITYEQLLSVIVARGRYPEETPIESLAPDFITGWINPYWGKIIETINGGTAA